MVTKEFATAARRILIPRGTMENLQGYRNIQSNKSGLCYEGTHPQVWFLVSALSCPVRHPDEEESSARPGLNVALTIDASEESSLLRDRSKTNLFRKTDTLVLPELIDLSHISNYWGPHKDLERVYIRKIVYIGLL